MQRFVTATCMTFSCRPVLEIDRDAMVFSTMGNWRSDMIQIFISTILYNSMFRHEITKTLIFLLNLFYLLLSCSPSKNPTSFTKAILDVMDIGGFPFTFIST